ncbi:unnamed protein product [Victoria cruziana]
MVAAHDAEADDVALVVEDLEALGGAAGGQAGDDAHLSEAADIAVAAHQRAASNEVLVRLGLVEAPDDGPDDADGGLDGLHDGGAALVGGDLVSVVAVQHIRHEGEGRRPLLLLGRDRPPAAAAAGRTSSRLRA